MTAVEIARARLAHATARRATPKRRRATPSPRHDDSGAQLALEAASESVIARSMITTADALPDDIGALHALILTERAERLAERAERAQFAERIAILERLNTKLEYIVAELRRAHFGRKSERITDEQLALALDELETAAAKAKSQSLVASYPRDPRSHVFRAWALADSGDKAGAEGAWKTELKGDKITEARVALGSVAHKPWRDRSAEAALRGQAVNQTTFARAADLLLRDAKGFEHNAFKIDLARRAVVRALTQAAAGTPQSQSNKKIC